MITRQAAIACLCAVSLVGIGGVQSKQTAWLTAADRDFLDMVSQGNQAEIQEARLIISKGTDAGVKSAAKRMIFDHSRVQDETRMLANSCGVAISAEPSGDQKESYKSLSGQSGTDLDLAYVKAQVKEHEEMIEHFRKRERETMNNELKTFVICKLPALEQHLQMFQQAQYRLDLSGEAKPTPLPK